MAFSGNKRDRERDARDILVAASQAAAASHGNVPPNDLEAERAVLGGVLLDNGALSTVDSIVAPSDFYAPAHAVIFESIQSLSSRGEAVDVVTLAAELRARERLNTVGGGQYLGELTDTIPTIAHIEQHARIVADLAQVRRMIGVAHEIVARGFGERGTADEFLDFSASKVFEIAQKRSKNPLIALEQAIQEAFERIEKTLERGARITGIETGFRDLDTLTAGMHPGQLIIIAARPAMGKCLAADAEIVLEDGSVATIEQIYRRGSARLLTLGDDLRLAVTSPSHYVDDGIKPVYRVTTRLGRVVQTTLTHPFLTAVGWKPLEQVRVGECVAVPRTLPVFGDRAMRPCEVKLLAYLIGDGGAGPVGVEFAEAVEEFESVMEPGAVHRGEDPSCATSGGSALRPVRSEYAAAERSRPAVPPAGNECPALARSASVPVGTADRAYPVHAIATGTAGSDSLAFHSMTWVGPARRRAGTLAQRQGRAFIPGRRRGEFTSRSARTASLAQWLAGHGLAALDPTKRRIPAAVFTLPPEQLALFLNRLFATSGWADEPASIGLASVSERVIRQVQHLLLRFGVVARVHRSDRWQLEITDAASVRAFAQHVGIVGQEDRVRAAADAVDRDLAQLAASDVYWDEVVAIEFVGDRQVYDLTVPGTHNFVANDVCVHNTSLVLNIAEHACTSTRKPVLFFSLEMPRVELANRLMCAEARVDQGRLRTNLLTQDDMTALTAAASRLFSLPMYIDDSGDLTLLELRAKARRMKNDRDLSLIVIDYLQLMRASRDGMESREREISEISRGLKSLAKELEVPIIALSQLNRGPESRAGKDKRPQLSDLRESGAIEQDADVVMFIYRDEVYNRDTEDRGIAEIIVAKQRNGPTDIVRTRFVRELTKFENLAEDDREYRDANVPDLDAGANDPGVDPGV